MNFYKLILFFLLISSNNIFAQNKIINSEHFGAGEYQFDTTSNFTTCRAKRFIYQYYNLKYKYPLKTDSCITALNKSLNYDNTINGTLTVRFVVNCEKRVGFFNIYEVNNLYQKISFPDKYRNSVLALIKELKNWNRYKILMNDGKEIFIDYYAYFSFKIINGQVHEIIP